MAGNFTFINLLYSAILYFTIFSILRSKSFSNFLFCVGKSFLIIYLVIEESLYYNLNNSLARNTNTKINTNKNTVYINNGYNKFSLRFNINFNRNFNRQFSNNQQNLNNLHSKSLRERALIGIKKG